MLPTINEKCQLFLWFERKTRSDLVQKFSHKPDMLACELILSRKKVGPFKYLFNNTLRRGILATSGVNLNR